MISILVLERRYYGDCSWKVTEDSFKTKDTDNIPVNSMFIIPQYCRSAPNNPMDEWEETSKMAAFTFRVVTALSSTLN